MYDFLNIFEIFTAAISKVKKMSQTYYLVN